ncbi:MAG TPA: cobalamin-independent methionine synthase II family protein [Streptosporangiaceae bacterium]|nr:cobalamin-independent methionine synthase II family protein [Streptosporangiaceae bacterium]
MATSGDILATTVVGSYPQPNWLIDRQRLGARLPPRVRAAEIWRIPPDLLAEAQDDATVLAIREMERAGIDVLTDGEMRRESYSNRFATALDGMDIANPGTAIDRTGHPNPVPRVTGPIRRARPVEVDDLRFLRANTDRRVKITLPGPFTMAQQAQNDYYPDDRALALDLAAAVKEEIADLFAAGADIVQLDEPYLQARAAAAREYAIEAINRAVEGAAGTIALHTCFGYAAIVHERPPGYAFLAELNDCAVDLLALETAQPDLDLSILRQVPDKGVILGVLDLASPVAESPERIADRIREALRHLPPDRLQIAPDCGMKYLDRGLAYAKLRAMVEATRTVRRELAG